MKKLAVIILLIAAVALIACAFGGSGEGSADASAYLRIHIRANSNGEDDQAVKYRVRDRVVEVLTPVVAECETKAEAMQKISRALPAVERAARDALRAEGYAYGVHADVRREQFPTRVYEGATLPAGVYDALILELGAGAGDNWWCVVYPPLCFSGAAAGENVQFRSRLLDIIRDFFAGE